MILRNPCNKGWRILPAIVAATTAGVATTASASSTSKHAGDAKQEEQEQSAPSIGHNLLLQTTLQLLPPFCGNCLFQLSQLFVLNWSTPLPLQYCSWRWCHLPVHYGEKSDGRADAFRSQTDQGWDRCAFLQARLCLSWPAAALHT